MASDLTKGLIIVFDIGGVLATIDHVSFNNFLKTHGALECDFYDQDFIAVQTGHITGQDFIRKKSKDLTIPLNALLHAFRRMIHVAHRGLLKKIHVPYFFASNINQVHYEEFIRELDSTEFSRRYARVSYQLGYQKPDERFFAPIRELGIPLGRTIYIDDNTKNLRFAKSLGLNAVYCHSSQSLPSLLKRLHLL